MIGDDDFYEVEEQKNVKRIRIRKTRLKQINRLRAMANFENYVGSTGLIMSREDTKSSLSGVERGGLRNCGYGSCSCRSCRTVSKINKEARRVIRKSLKNNLRNEIVDSIEEINDDGYEIK